MSVGETGDCELFGGCRDAVGAGQVADFILSGALFKARFDEVEFGFMGANEAFQQHEAVAFTDFQDLPGIIDLPVHERHDVRVDGLSA